MLVLPIKGSWGWCVSCDLISCGFSLWQNLNAFSLISFEALSFLLWLNDLSIKVLVSIVFPQESGSWIIATCSCFVRECDYSRLLCFVMLGLVSLKDSFILPCSSFQGDKSGQNLKLIQNGSVWFSLYARQLHRQESNPVQNNPASYTGWHGFQSDFVSNLNTINP